MTIEFLMQILILLGTSALSCTLMFVSLGSKRSWFFTISTLALFTTAFICILIYTGHTLSTLSARELYFLPIILLLFKGTFLQKIFAILLQMIFTTLFTLLTEFVVGVFVPVGTLKYFIVLTTSLLVIFLLFGILVLCNGHTILNKLFRQGTTGEWLLYSFGAAFSLIIIYLLHHSAIANTPVYIFVLLFIFWSFFVLCFSIIHTHDKAAAEFELTLSRNVINSGERYYALLTKQAEELKVIRHDQRHHLAVLHGLFGHNYKTEALEYLQELESRNPTTVTAMYSGNNAVDALVSSIATRCQLVDIAFEVAINLPKPLTIPNYDLCIVLGNLFENALTGCATVHDSKPRFIQLTVKPAGRQLAILIQNSFDGIIQLESGQLKSRKDNGGIGLHSVRMITNKLGGEVYPLWENDVFSTRVLLNL